MCYLLTPNMVRASTFSIDPFVGSNQRGRDYNNKTSGNCITSLIPLFEWAQHFNIHEHTEMNCIKSHA